MDNYLTAVEDIVYLSLEKTLKNLSLTDVKIFNSNLNNLESESTYLVFTLYNFEQIGEAGRSSTISSVGETTESISHHHGKVQISVIGNKSSKVASSLHWALQNDMRAYDAFAYNRVKVFGVDRGLRKAAQLREAEWVDGYNFDMSVSATLHVKYSYDWVEYITLNGESIKLPYSD